jgi:hypothetical protein
MVTSRISEDCSSDWGVGDAPLGSAAQAACHPIRVVEGPACAAVGPLVERMISTAMLVAFGAFLHKANACAAGRVLLYIWPHLVGSTISGTLV